MLRRMNKAILILLVLGLLSAGCQQGTSYPTKPIEYVVHSSAGGGTDILARAIADIMSKEKIVAQPMNVVNKSGGASAVATAYVAEKKGDPYFIYNITASQITAQLQGQSKVTLKELTPVVKLLDDVNAVVVSADSPYKTLEDLIAASKTQNISQGGGAITSGENMTGYLIKKATGAKWEFVSFNSGGEAITALLGGHVQVAMPGPSEVMEQLRAGKVRILAVNVDKRLAIWPDVPTLKEKNITTPPGLIRGVMMPGGVSDDAVKYWEGAFGKMRQTAAWKKYLADNGLTDEGWLNSKDFGAYIEKMTPQFDGLMREMGLIK